MKERIERHCDRIKQLLVKKNEAYGSAATEPLGVFSKLSPAEGIMVRIDDKLKRIKNSGITEDTEDTIQDLIGYLILLKIAKEDEEYTTGPDGHHVSLREEEERASTRNLSHGSWPNTVSEGTDSNTGPRPKVKLHNPFEGTETIS
jgi:hypothetical protein